MLNSNYYCVIMAGGVGARFWPMSNKNTPKQFMDILGDGKTLIQKTFDRFARICPKENIYIVTNKAYHDITREQLPDIADEQIMLEPYRRNTAPCIAYANFKIREKNPNAVVVVAPSDHMKMPAFHKKSPLSKKLFAISNSGFSVKVFTAKTEEFPFKTASSLYWI